MFDLKNQVAVVTGSTSGIGKGIAEEFAKAGAIVVLNGRHESEKNETQRHGLETKYHTPVYYFQADLAKRDEAIGLIKKTADQLGRVDILVNNAGIQHVAPFSAFPIEKWDSIMAVHLTAAYLTAQTAFPYMQGQQSGRIINIASAHASTASVGKVAYITAKHAQIGLTKAIAMEGAPYGITCNTISPGYVWTPLVENQIRGQSETLGISMDDVQRDVFLRVHPTRKFTTVKDVAQAALFLASPAAHNMTGGDIALDGGWTAGQVSVPIKPLPKRSANSAEFADELKR